MSQLYFGFGLIEIYKSIIEIKKLNSTHTRDTSSFYSFLFFLYTKFRSYIESIYTDFVPWNATYPKIYDYLMSNAGKKVFMMNVFYLFIFLEINVMLWYRFYTNHMLYYFV